MRKRRTREHVIADLSVNFVERQVLLCGHTVERVFHDYEYDLFLFTFDANGEPEAGEIRVQVKATDHLPSDNEIETIPFRIARSDLVYWLEERLPVLFVLYDAQSGIAYWIDVKTYFRQLSDFNIFAIGRTITVRIPRSNVFEGRAVNELADLKNRERRSNRHESV